MQYLHNQLSDCFTIWYRGQLFISIGAYNDQLWLAMGHTSDSEQYLNRLQLATLRLKEIENIRWISFCRRLSPLPNGRLCVCGGGVYGSTNS